MTSGDQGNPRPKGIGKDCAMGLQRCHNAREGHRQQPAAAPSKPFVKMPSSGLFYFDAATLRVEIFLT